MKTKWISLVTSLMLISTSSFAAVARVLDGTAITAGSPSNVLTLPQTTDTLTGRATTDTLTNKSISGATNTISSVSAGTSLTGQVPVANGGTGAASLSSGSVVLGAGTSPVTVVAPGSSGNVLTSNGSTWTSSAPPATSPSLNGGSASPESVTASGGITLSSISYENFVWVVGSPGAVTVTKTPSITACTADGQKLHIIGTDATNTVTLQDNAGLAGSALQLNGTWVGGLYSVINLTCNITLGMWEEESRR